MHGLLLSYPTYCGDIFNPCHMTSESRGEVGLRCSFLSTQMNRQTSQCQFLESTPSFDFPTVSAPSWIISRCSAFKNQTIYWPCANITAVSNASEVSYTGEPWSVLALHSQFWRAERYVLSWEEKRLLARPVGCSLLSFLHCPCFTSVVKISDKSDWGDRVLIIVHRSRIQSFTPGRSGWQTLRVTSHMTSTVRSRDRMKACPLTAQLIFTLSHPGPTSKGWYRPQWPGSPHIIRCNQTVPRKAADHPLLRALSLWHLPGDFRLLCW